MLEAPPLLRTLLRGTPTESVGKTPLKKTPSPSLINRMADYRSATLSCINALFRDGCKISL